MKLIMGRDFPHVDKKNIDVIIIDLFPTVTGDSIELKGRTFVSTPPVSLKNQPNGRKVYSRELDYKVSVKDQDKFYRIRTFKVKEKIYSGNLDESHIY